MSVAIIPGTPLADALDTAIQAKIADLGWAGAGAGAEVSAMSEYFILMLANGKTEDEITAEIAGDLLGLGSNEPSASAFSSWLFEQIAALNAQLPGSASVESQTAPEASAGEPMSATSLDSEMDMATDSLGNDLNAPTGPKAMRNGAGSARGGREKRMVGQINRALDRNQDSALHRVRGQTGTERISRTLPTGPRMGTGRQPRATNVRTSSVAAGLAGMGPMALSPVGPMRMGPPVGPPVGSPMGINGMAPMNGMNGMNGMGGMGGINGMSGGMNAMNGGMNGGMGGGTFMAPDLYAMMEQQGRMLQQLMMQQHQQQQGGMAQNGQGRGKSLFERAQRPSNSRRGGGHQQHTGGVPALDAQEARPEAAAPDPPAGAAPAAEDMDMSQPKAEQAKPEETICKFNLRCQNKDCGFAHQSPAAPPGITIDVTDSCSYGAACKNFKCVGRHPSPATRVVHQGEQDCKFFPNCTNPACTFRHPTMPPCRNGGECKVPNCKFTHVKTMCRFHPCTNRFCLFSHEEGQRGTFQDKVWMSTEAKAHPSERKFVNEDGQEELVLPGSGMDDQMEHGIGAAEAPNAQEVVI